MTTVRKIDDPEIVPGNEYASSFCGFLRFESFEMPPREKLDQAVADRFAKWIADGAFDPHNELPTRSTSRIDPTASRDHWAFQRVHLPAVPSGADWEFPDKEFAGWVQTPIDAFVMRTLGEKGWGPADQADKYTLTSSREF